MLRLGILLPKYLWLIREHAVCKRNATSAHVIYSIEIDIERRLHAPHQTVGFKLSSVNSLLYFLLLVGFYQSVMGYSVKGAEFIGIVSREVSLSLSLLTPSNLSLPICLYSHSSIPSTFNVTLLSSIRFSLIAMTPALIYNVPIRSPSPFQTLTCSRRRLWR